MKNNDYIRHVPHLRNSRAYDHDFWYTFLSFNFEFLRCYWGKWARNGPKMTKKIPSVALHISGTIGHNIVICGTQI